MAGREKRKKRRTRTAHPGVKLKRRARQYGEVWLARWTDPTTRRGAEASLTALGLTTAEARRAWAIEKSRKLTERKRQLASGVVPVPRMSIKDAIEDYLSRGAERLKAKTIRGYRESLEKFREWAQSTGIRTVNELNPPALVAFKDTLARGKKRVVVPGGRRGERKLAHVPYAAKTINMHLLRIRVFLHEARRRGRTPNVDRDAVGDSLSSVRGERPRPAFLRPAEMRQLLEAALRHDSDTYQLTRAEKAGKATPGGTPKYPPIAPFVLFLVLSGCRLGEARYLRWSWCYLTGKNPEIILPAAEVKTRHERSVDLNVSPSLVKLLGILRVRAGEMPFVFGGDLPLTEDIAKAAHRRLVSLFGAPPSFTWQKLRSSCATYLTNAGAIYGGASAYLSARRLGHSVVVAEQRYAGVFRDIPKDATTLEKAMDIEDLAARIVAGAGGAGAVMTTENEVATGTTGA